MSLLTICQGAALRCNFGTVPSQAYSSTDTSVLQLVAFAQDTGRELLERANWNGLKNQALITGDGSSTLFTLPSDWMRLCPSDKSPMGALISLARPTIPLIGPVNDEWLNQMKALPTYPAYPVWRIVNNQLEIWPALSSGEVVQFWYFTKNWILQYSTSNYVSSWTNDNDTSVIDETLIMKGAIWQWKRAKGLDYAEEFRAYQLSVERNAGQQDNERVVSTSDHSVNSENFWPGQMSYTPP
jgi:hypothetical protein